MMLFAAHNSGPLSPNFCINTRCRGFHLDILSRRFPKPAGLPLARSGFSANATPLGSLAFHQPCYPKHFSLTLNTAFPLALQLSQELFFFFFSPCSTVSCKRITQFGGSCNDALGLFSLWGRVITLPESIPRWTWLLWLSNCLLQKCFWIIHMTASESSRRLLWILQRARKLK